MRTTRTFLAAMALGIGGSLGAYAGLVYNNEFTTDWFDAGVQNLTPGATLPTQSWTVPTEPDAVTVGNGKITLDTDLESPLSYTTPSVYSNVAVVAATFTVTPNAAFPDIDEAPQAALTVVSNGTSTNWVGLVGDSGTNKWETFAATPEVPAPVAGKTYSVSILFDQSSSSRKIRYLVNGKYLNNWVDNPKSTASDISSVSFSGSGDITALAGTNIIETAATFNGQSFSTFDAALAAAKKSGSGWGAGNPVVLYKNATYEATESGLIYINENGKVLTVSGGVVKKDGNTFTITKNDDCEAEIGDKYYAKFAEAFTAATDGQTIEIQKQVADAVGALDVAKNLTLSGCDKLSGCTALTVAAGKTLTLTGAFAVGNATVNGSVAGDALVVSGTLNGTAVESLTFAAGATFTYAGTVLAPTTLTLPVSGTVAISFTVVPDNGAPIITASELDAAKFTGAPNGRVFKVEGDSLTLAPGATITKTDEEEGFDYTNGTVSVTASVGSGKTGTATLKVVDFATGNVITAYDAKTIGSDDLTWQLADKLEQLTPGGTYSYEVEVKVDDVVVATQAGTFTAAKWPKGIWFGADASKSTDRELNGSWESTKNPAVVDNAYVIEEDALFNVSETVVDMGTNHVTRVDAVVTFESLIDADSLETESDALGGFVAAKSGDVPQWMALTSNDEQPWVALTGALAPEANVQYVIRAEIDFQSASKRVRYLVSTDGGTNFYPLANATAQWIPLADANKKTLAKVELKGAGSLAKFEAWIANKSVAKIGNTEYDSMDAALEAAGTNGTNTITLLTNATVEPTKPGSYDIAPNSYHYASGGQISTDTTNTKTIVVTEDGPVVRPSTAEMKAVKTPENAQFKDVNSLRAFLERNGVAAYTTDYVDPQHITDALKTVPTDAVNGLELWKDYALGIDKTDPVAPVTIPTGDVDPANITLAIPKVVAAIEAGKPSGDYSFSFKVVNANDATKEILPKSPAEIKIPLDAGTGTYEIKVIFTATPAND